VTTPQLPLLVPRSPLFWLQYLQVCDMIHHVYCGCCRHMHTLQVRVIPRASLTVIRGRDRPHAQSLVVVCLSGVIFVVYWRWRRRRTSKAVKARMDAEDGQGSKDTHSSANSFHSDLPPMTLRDSYGAHATPALALTWPEQLPTSDGPPDIAACGTINLFIVTAGVALKAAAAELPEITANRADRIAVTMAARSRSLYGSMESVSTSRKSWPLVCCYPSCQRAACFLAASARVCSVMCDKETVCRAGHPRD